ncbi:unnamed protein product [Anisakis simplex]|uniref:Uncharacterized protein n=1 Tax=Anisakis simplex TaxID=6269 RepID=A0A3P6N4I9_ANISI|nr:unnamed protein product [Anisakis simplex]
MIDNVQNEFENGYELISDNKQRECVVVILAAVLCGKYISDGNWDRLGAIMSLDEVDYLKERYDSLEESDKSKLRFSFDDVICTFLHSTFITGKRIFRGEFGFSPKLNPFQTLTFFRYSHLSTFDVDIYQCFDY